VIVDMRQTGRQPGHEVDIGRLPARVYIRKPRGLNLQLSCMCTQEGSFMASLGMKCTAGGCLYDAGGPQPPAPPVPHEHKTNLVRAFSCAARCTAADFIVRYT